MNPSSIPEHHTTNLRLSFATEGKCPVFGNLSNITGVCFSLQKCTSGHGDGTSGREGPGGSHCCGLALQLLRATLFLICQKYVSLPTSWAGGGEERWLRGEAPGPTAFSGVSGLPAESGAGPQCGDILYLHASLQGCAA